jgi:hypothetical protein
MLTINRRELMRAWHAITRELALGTQDATGIMIDSMVEL